MGALIKKSDPAPIRACTVSRDVQAFEFLIDDMEAILGEAWGDLHKGPSRAAGTQHPPRANSK